MGVTTKIFVVEEDGAVHPIQYVRFTRLLRGDPATRFPEYAGRSMRVAVTLVQLASRKPRALLRIDCVRVPFTTEGTLDRHTWREGMRLAIESLDWSALLPPPPPLHTPPKIIDARSTFAREQYQRLHTWTPGAAVKDAIIRTLFKGARA